MPLPQLRRSTAADKVFWPLLTALLPLVLGLPLIYWQAQDTLQRQTQASVDAAMAKIEQILDQADYATERVSALAGTRCDTAAFSLRQQSMAVPYVRSLNLAENGKIYCTSLAGVSHDSENASEYVDGRLRLMPGNQVTPGRAVLIFRRAVERGSVLAGIDGQYISNALELAGPQSPLTLRIGDYQLRPDGTVSRVDTAKPVSQDQTLSQRYPISLHADFPAGVTPRFLATHFAPMLLMLLLLGGLFGGGVYWLDRRSNSPLREMRRALHAGEFMPYYQPVVDGAPTPRESDAFAWKGVEVLMRWRHPSEGLIPPDQFIPLAERSGLIGEMTHSLMQHVRDELLPHVDLLPPGFHVGFNITAVQCRDIHLLSECREFLAAFPAGSIRLVLELTERELLEPDEHSDRLFGELRAMGVYIAIDDFGTGHASLAYLRQFRVDYLKIDRSFVSMVGRDALSQHLLDNIIDLSTRLALGVVAEGIENREQLDYLRTRGVRYLQGYFFARPVPIDDLTALLKRSPMGDETAKEPAPAEV